MRTTLRQLSTRNLLLHQPRNQSTFVCSRCRNNKLLRPGSSQPSLFQWTQHRAKSTDEKLPFGEKLRRKIWATDKPPGQKNPYEKLTPEQRAKEIEEREAEAERERLEEDTTMRQVDAAPPPITDGYTPAATWDGLDQIGGAEGWWEEAWDKENQFMGFATQTKIDPSQMSKALRQAVIELITLQTSHKPFGDVSRLSVHNQIDHGFVKVNASEIGNFEVHYDDIAIRHDLLKEAEVGEEDAHISTVEATNTTKSISNPPDGCKWLQVPLGDLDFKFAYLKRVTQLTGRIIPDPEIQRLHTVEDVVKLLTKKPEPTKLAEALLDRADLMALPNVEIFPRRHTPIDKEMEVGRWKVIEQELKKRDLPVTGHR